MKKLYTLIVICSLYASAKAQIITFTDQNFKTRLLASTAINTVAQDFSGNWIKIDANNNSQIEVTEAAVVKYLDLSSSNISDLTGISNFSNLLTLFCTDNNISSFSFSGLGNLSSLYIAGNNLTSLNASEQPNLVVLNCDHNELSSLLVNGLTDLAELYCKNNQLTTLDISGLNLNTLACDFNQLTTLDVSSLNNLTYLGCSNNQLTSLDVDNLQLLTFLYCPNNQITSIDVDNLNYLQRLYCSSNLLTSINVSGHTSLLQLYCDHNMLTTIDVRGLYNLDRLLCNDNLLTSLYFNNSSIETVLDFSNNPTLTDVCTDAVQLASTQDLISNYGYTNCNVTTNCSTNNSNVYIPDANFKAKLLAANTTNATAKNADGNAIVIDTNEDNLIQLSEVLQVAELNVRNSSIQNFEGIGSFENLRKLSCQENSMEYLMVTNLTSLTDLEFSFCPNLHTLNADGCASLQNVNLDTSELFNISLNGTGISDINFSNPSLGYISMENCPSLHSFTASGNQNLSSLRLSGNSNLVNLNVSLNPVLHALSVSGCSSLTNLDVAMGNNALMELDMTSCTSVQTFSAQDNSFYSLDLTGLQNLTTIYCQSLQMLSDIDITGLTNLNTLVISSVPITTLDLSGVTNLTSLVIGNTNIESLDLNQAANLASIQVSSNSSLDAIDISALHNLTSVKLESNHLETITLGDMPQLNLFSCNANALTTLDFSKLLLVSDLYFASNQFSGTFDCTIFPNLKRIGASSNSFTSVNAVGMENLERLSFDYNNLSSIDLTGLGSLKDLDLGYNQISTLDLSNTPNLEHLFIDANPIFEMDFSGLTHFNWLMASSMPLLKNVFLKNGSVQEYLSMYDCPMLQYVCVDEEELAVTEFLPITNPTCVVNSYCTFSPGGWLFTLLGNNKFDANNNGCDVSDVAQPNLKFTVSNEITSSNIIANASGSYSISVGEGNYTLTPVLENPSYFAVSPTSVSVSFPTSVSPFLQDFCITPIGQHNDLEVTVVPVMGARPGFDAHYKIQYRNKGNTIQSGTVAFQFNDTVLDYISSVPNLSNQTTASLQWSFENLLPLQSREIEVVLNVNSPVETPSVNGGDILNYSATITSVITDEFAEDNAFALNETVVNSFDPNDKTCLEGDTIAPEKIGQYVHYKIRFENTGTYFAENIVVKDVIDTAKFDISTLVPMNASHPFTTRISNGNNVEFLFQNIMLPFDDANNDGYVSFKIKTLPTLVVNDTFENTASIYFDYNTPIVTNTASTSFQTLGVSDDVFSKCFSVYPNPTTRQLNIAKLQSLEIESIAVFNTIGQLIVAIPDAKNTKAIDVSHLQSGTYFIRIVSDKGTSNMKFIKQ